MRLCRPAGTQTPTSWQVQYSWSGMLEPHSKPLENCQKYFIDMTLFLLIVLYIPWLVDIDMVDFPLLFLFFVVIIIDGRGRTSSGFSLPCNNGWFVNEWSLFVSSIKSDSKKKNLPIFPNNKTFLSINFWNILWLKNRFKNIYPLT